MKQDPMHTIEIGGRKVDYRLLHSKSARKIRVRVGISGVEVIKPDNRDSIEIEKFLKSNGDWIISQIDRTQRLRNVRKPSLINTSVILFRGAETPVHTEDIVRRRGTNKVFFDNGKLIIVQGMKSRTQPAQSLENWLRNLARKEILSYLDTLIPKIGMHPNKLYVMDQKTKWGNCSALHNLSFNWRLIMAPDYVLHYIVTHEVVHLKIPDHSKRFWLTVQSLCPDMDRARQWLAANSDRLMISLHQICPKRALL